jgi:dihydroneopterin aldolase
MKLEKSTIFLKNLRFHAYHGVMEQERVVGNDYVVNVRMEVPVDEALKSDRVEDTVSYAEVFEIVRREMAVPSQLIEHVAGRMAHALEEAFPQTESVTITIIKVNPPMGADSDGAGVELTFKKEQSK